MRYYLSNKNFSSPRRPIVVNEKTGMHDAPPVAKVRLVWLKEDSAFPCGVVFANTTKVVWSKEKLEKVLNIKYLLGRGGRIDPDGQYRSAQASIADAVRERNRAYHRSVGRQKLTHRMIIPPELLQ